MSWTCKHCSKEYTNQNKYISHEKHCLEKRGINQRKNQGKKESRQASRQASHQASRQASRFGSPSESYTGSHVGSHVGSHISVSDIERYRSTNSEGYSGSSHRYRGEVGSQRESRNTIKKLSRDKTKLKDKLKKLMKEFTKREDEFHSELDRAQEYYQEQLSTMADERNHAYDEVETTHETIYEEKNKLRDDFSQKLQSHKEIMEKRYNSNNSSTINRLKKTIGILQTKLTQEISTRHTHDDEKKRNIVSETYQKNLLDLEERLRTAQTQVAEHTRELNVIGRANSHEKEQLRLQLVKEKDTEIQNLIVEKNNIVRRLEKSMKSLEDRDRNQKRAQQATIARTEQKIDQQNHEHENKIKSMTIEFTREKKTILDNGRSRIFEVERKAKKDIENAEIKMTKQVDSLKYQHERQIDTLSTGFRHEIDGLRSENKKIDYELDQIGENFTKQLTIRTDDLKKTNYEEVQSVTNRLEGKLLSQIQEATTQKERDKKIIKNLSTVNMQHEHQICQLQNNLQNLKDKISTITNKFTKNLETQKEELRKEILQKEEKNSQLIYECKQQNGTARDREGILVRKLTVATEENKGIVNRYNQAKKMWDELEQKVIENKKELFRYRQWETELEYEKKTIKQTTSDMTKKLNHITQKFAKERATSDKLKLANRNLNEEVLKLREDVSSQIAEVQRVTNLLMKKKSTN